MPKNPWKPLFWHYTVKKHQQTKKFKYFAQFSLGWGIQNCSWIWDWTSTAKVMMGVPTSNWQEIQLCANLLYKSHIVHSVLRIRWSLLLLVLKDLLTGDTSVLYICTDIVYIHMTLHVVLFRFLGEVVPPWGQTQNQIISWPQTDSKYIFCSCGQKKNISLNLFSLIYSLGRFDRSCEGHIGQVRYGSILF